MLPTTPKGPERANFGQLPRERAKSRPYLSSLGVPSTGLVWSSATGGEGGLARCPGAQAPLPTLIAKQPSPAWVSPSGASLIVRTHQRAKTHTAKGPKTPHHDIRAGSYAGCLPVGRTDPPQVQRPHCKSTNRAPPRRPALRRVLVGDEPYCKPFWPMANRAGMDAVLRTIDRPLHPGHASLRGPAVPFAQQQHMQSPAEQLVSSQLVKPELRANVSVPLASSCIVLLLGGGGKEGKLESWGSDGGAGEDFRIQYTAPAVRRRRAHLARWCGLDRPKAVGCGGLLGLSHPRACPPPLRSEVRGIIVSLRCWAWVAWSRTIGLDSKEDRLGRQSGRTLVPRKDFPWTGKEGKQPRHASATKWTLTAARWGGGKENGAI